MRKEPCGNCEGSGRWLSTTEESPTELVDLGPCPDCRDCPQCSLPMSLSYENGDENNWPVWYCDGPNDNTDEKGCFTTVESVYA